MVAVPHPYPRPVLVSSPLAPGVPHPHSPPVQSQPKTVALECRRLLSLPYRLVHPPPARGLVTSWGVVPKFEVSLDDILDRKHLPPLGLKDFEEWLLFVEQAAENLYFILWLRDYTQRYTDWVRSTKLTRTASYGTGARREYRTPSVLPPASPELSYSYTQAKRTFLTPNGAYELDVPSDVLAPFHIPPAAKSVSSLAQGEGVSAQTQTAWSETTCGYGYGLGSFDRDMVNAPLPPDPAVFGELAYLVREMLQESLDRFVLATYNNVGTPRALCGSAGGIVIGLAGSAPLIVNFAVGGSRWWRLTAIPGMWLGLTIFISAMYGVCMMIYVFGDLRQLRSFELVRPPISAPQLHPSPSASAASLFYPRIAPATPLRAPSLPQLNFNPFRRAQRRPIPEISPPMALARPSSVAFLRMAAGAPTDTYVDVSMHEKAGPPKLTIVTPPPVGSRWSEDSAVRVPQRAVTRASRRAGGAERAVSRMSSLASISSAEYTDDGDGEGCAHDSGYEDDDDEAEAGSACGHAPRIEISDAFYDEHPSPEGPATASGTGTGVPLWPDYVGSEEEEMTATAAFIHPFSYADAVREKEGLGSLASAEGVAGDLEAQNGRGIAARQPVDPFDFDALPPRRPRFAKRGVGVQGKEEQRGSKGGVGALARTEPFSPRAALKWYQSKCSPENVVRVHLGKEKEREREKGGWGFGWGVASGASPLAPSPTVTLAGSPTTTMSTATTAAFMFPASPTSTLGPANVATVLGAGKHEHEHEAPLGEKEEMVRNLKERTPKMSWRDRFRSVQAVPAFAVPLTPVLNPVVTRAQWEIVVRSAMIAIVVCVVVVGGLTGAPVPHR